MPNLDFPSRLVFFLLYSVVVVAFGLVLFFLFNSKYITAVIAVGCLILLLTGLRIAVFGGTSDNKVRLRVVSASTVILFAALQLKSTALSLAKPFLERAASELNIPISESTFESSSPLDYYLATVIIAGWVIVCVFLLRNLRTSPMGRPSEVQLSDILTEPAVNDRIRSLKASLRNKLDIINAQTQWSDTNYVPLEAEVQILEGKTTRRKVVDLLKAIQVNPKTGLFIVLGEPGTGKSVALRTLTSELLGHSGVKDRIPIYINLKEWRTDAVWTIDNKPTVQDFHDFVFSNLLQGMDTPSQSFLKQHFDVLLAKGFLFFIFDSFDEIPAVLDHDEDSWIIGELSNCISTYVLNSRGIIASRLFRQPDLKGRRRTVLEIQPFSDDRIVRAIRIAGNNPDRLVKIILNERVDLGTIARNPFLLNLIIYHFNEVKEAPESQAAMFQTFIDSNFDSAKRTLSVKDLGPEEFYRTCEDISGAMFEKSQGGLEIGELELRDRLDLPNLPYVLRFLVSARIGRIAPVSGAFSFSHRRFNEYFLVRRLRSKRIAIPFDSIQTDSRWRDALVLYAEIAEDSDARALIAHAWGFAGQLGTLSLGGQRSEFVMSRNALRFIIEGFRNRPEIVAPYRPELSAIIAKKLENSSGDYIETKTVLEGLGLLDAERATATILTALEVYPGWISEQAVTAARYLPSIKPNLAVGIYRHFVDRGGFRGLIEARRQARLLSVSDAFKEVSSLLKWYIADVYKTWLFALSFVSVVAFYQFPPLVTATALAGSLVILIWIGVRTLLFMTGNATFWSYTSFLKVTAFAVLATALLPYANRYFSPDTPNSLLPKALFPAEPMTEATLVAFILLIGIVLPLSARFWSGIARGMLAIVRGLSGLLGKFSISALRPDLAKLWSQKGELIGPAIAASTFLAILGLANLIPDWFKKWLEYFAGWVALVGGGGIALFAIGSAVRQLRRQQTDKRDINHVIKDFRPERRDIAANFVKLRTGWGRLRYVTQLEEVALDHIDAFKRPDNVWPDGIRPQYGDAASTKLAQLDARWLGLD